MSGNPNLRPYGDPWSNAAQTSGAGSIEEHAQLRAIAKLEDLRTGRSGDREAGVDLLMFIPSVLVAVIIGLPLAALTVAFLGTKDGALGAVIFGTFALACFALPVAVFVQTRATTAKGALTSFYKRLAGNRPKSAAKLVLRADMDDFPRYQPQIAYLGRPSGYPRPFRDERAFAEYWRELLLGSTAAYCIPKVKILRETDIGPDIKLVDIELKLIMNTRLWLLLIFVALLIAILADLATRKTVQVSLRKVLVRVGNEWHLFSGEWQGYDEFNIAWLQGTPPAQFAPPASPAQPAAFAPPHQPPRAAAPWEQPKADGPTSTVEKAPWEC